jgi:hypothetical protein
VGPVHQTKISHRGIIQTKTLSVERTLQN